MRERDASRGDMGVSWRERLMPAAIGVGIVGLAALIAWTLTRDIENAPGRLRGDWLFLLVPTMVVLGLVMLVRGLIWGAPAFSSRTFLFGGLFMLVVGIFPWAWTPLLIRDGGMESSGMLGTLVFLTVGLPGALVAFAGWLLRRLET